MTFEKWFWGFVWLCIFANNIPTTNEERNRNPPTVASFHSSRQPVWLHAIQVPRLQRTPLYGKAHTTLEGQKKPTFCSEKPGNDLLCTTEQGNKKRWVTGARLWPGTRQEGVTTHKRGWVPCFIYEPPVNDVAPPEDISKVGGRVGAAGTPPPVV